MMTPEKTALCGAISQMTGLPGSRIAKILVLFEDALGEEYSVEIEMTEVGWMFTGTTEDEKDCVTVVFGSEIELVPMGSA